MGETRVNLLRILEDLRDAYPGSIEETIVTEVVANALDSGAREVSIHTDPAAATFTVSDDGKGMAKQALSRYHDLAASTKSRGRTIGFAGVGIKLGLLVSDHVVTESRSRRSHRATTWRLSSESRAPWTWIEPPGLQEDMGTSVRLYLRNAFSTLLDPGYVESVIATHFRPLFDAAFGDILSPSYGEGVSFRINGRPIPRYATQGDRVPIAVRVGRQRKASGVGYLLRDQDLTDEERGVAVSTLGKVIKRGWDWLGLSPGEADGVTGLIEVPSLVEALTLNKADFVRRGDRAQTFLAYRKAVQDVVATQLREWGDAPRGASVGPRRTRTLERDLRSVIAGLADHFPVLATLAERARGGQKAIPFGKAEDAVGPVPATPVAGEPRSPRPAQAEPPGTASIGSERASAEGAVGRVPMGPTPAASGRRRAARFGLEVRFESRPDDPELGRLLESTVWVNEAHPAYRRAVAARSEGYHVALATALSLARYAVEAEQAHDFVTAFMAEWGRAGSRR
jgi:hypothetical protein